VELGQQAEEELDYHQLEEGLAGQVPCLEIVLTKKMKRKEKGQQIMSLSYFLSTSTSCTNKKQKVALQQKAEQKAARRLK
jgi:hypothetical protein